MTSHSTSTGGTSTSTESTVPPLQDGLPQSTTDSLILFLLLPAIAMSLGWGLRGTIGGGPIGALIPGVIVMLSLALLLGWTSSLAIVAAIGTVGIGLGGQETYGQTIGFLRDPGTVLWGLSGLTLKGAMWGISGGVLVGLGFMHPKYRWWELALGLLIMVGVTLLCRELIDKPKYLYFSNPLEKPREEAWVAITLGAFSLLVYLWGLHREQVSTAFALGGLVAGAAGFGFGSLFIALGQTLPKPYFGWEWWKMMEFTFGALYGLGLGAIAFSLRHDLLRADQQASERTSVDPLTALPNPLMTVVGLAVAITAILLNFGIPIRTSFTVVAAGLILLSLFSNRLSWHVALSLTIAGFLRDLLRWSVEKGWQEKTYDHWAAVAIITLPIVILVVWAESRRRLSAQTALLGVTWLATACGIAKINISSTSYFSSPFVASVFFVEMAITTLLVLSVQPKQTVRST
ncbi:hypothetical protein [Schlesneria sp. T3-172]|uniref:hypothetical protein n=1 Tax=Schlesneria sphaerica TaxID=3373610 RepID=UPI0037C8D86F